MRQTLKRSISFLLAFVMVTGLFATMPFTTFAAGVDYNHNASTSTDEYYNLISKQDWDNAPGISESEIVLNNDAGSYRQVIHIMKADINNEYVDVIPTYAEMDTSKYQTAIMMDQANWIDENMEGEVIGVMNCCLSWYSGYPAERAGEPLGFMMMDGEIMFDPGNCGYNYGAVGFPTCVVINKDFNDAGEARPADIPKLEMVQIRTSADLDGWEDTVIPISSGYIVKDGVNQNKPNHSGPAPRSVVGITADGQVVIMENDGRQEPFSAGMNMYECAEVMLAAGCVWAANCDGGGSSTFISQRPGEELKVNNSVSDGVERASTSGICFISTAPATGEFVRATITTDDEYYTPKSSVKFNAVGTDLVGTLVDIPAEAYWQVTDGMGSIDESGLFVSNGTTGVATAELVYEGKVVGSASINVVIPEEIAFNQNVITLPNGETTKLVINAKHGVHSVVTKLEDFDIVLSDGTVGTLNGFEFTATSDTAITGGSITATLVHDTSKVAGATLRFGRASEVLFDFEDVSSFADTWKTTDWKNAGVINNSGGYYAKYGVYAVNKTNGKVHDGNGAMAMVNDFSYGNSTSWNSFYVNYYGEPIKIENAQAIGCWVYVPNDTPYVEFYLRVTNDSGKNVGKNLIYGDPDTPAKTGWQYISFDISQYKYITFNPGDKFIQVYYGGIQGVGSLIDDPELNYKSTYYIDTVTVDYSTAVADREAPVFSAPQIIDSLSTVSEVNGQTVTSSVNTFEVAVADFVKDNAVGINAATAKAYIDGNSMSCKYANGKIVLADVSMADGTHTITFTIEDSNGNLAEISRKIKIAANSNTPTASVVPHDATLDRILIGSLYYLDVNVTNVELTDKVELTINLNNLSQWELDHMTVAKGFEATYVIDATDPMDQIATITITRVGESDIVGAGTVASLPVRTWEWKQDEAPTVGGKYYTPEDAWEDSYTYYTVVKAYDIEGTLTLTDSTKVPFGADDIQVDTELWGNSATGVPNTEIFNGKDGIHVHTAAPMDDVAATCTEAGYTGRTFCEVCNSVVDWGTVVEAAGHDYEIVDGKLTCSNGGELFNGVYTDGKTYVDGIVVADGWNDEHTSYYVDGVKLTGSHIIDKAVYTFDYNGNYLPNHIYNGFITDSGVTMYFYTNTNYEVNYLYINDTAYYFTDGIAKDGAYIINDETCLFEDGVYVSCITADVLDAGWMGETVTYIIYSDKSMILGGEGATYKYTSRAQLPWVKLKTQIRSIFVGKDITALNQFSLADIYYATNITFEEDSKLTYIGPGAILSCYGITEIVLPDSLETVVQNAFKMCKNLVDVYLPYNVKYLHKLSFVNNQNVPMDKIVFHVYEGTYAEDYAKQYNIPCKYRVFVDKVIANGTCGTNATWEVYQSGKLVINGSGAVDNFADRYSMPWYEYINDIKYVVVGKDITSIGNFAFAYALALETVTFEEGSKLENIGAASFLYVHNLFEIVIPETVTKIGNNAFSYCKALTNITIPQDVTLIYPTSFNKCTKVVLDVADGTYGEQYAKNNGLSYTVRDYVDAVVASGVCGNNATWTLYKSGKLVIDGFGAMDNYTGKETTPWAAYLTKISAVVIGKDITHVGNFAFAYATNAKTLIFEEGSKLETIGAASFLYLHYVTEVTIPETVTKIGNNAFSYCKALTNITIPQDVTLIYPTSFNKCTKVVLDVADGTYGEQYAKNNGLSYTVRDYVDAVVASGVCGNNATWTLYKSGKLVIDGFGAMDNYTGKETTPWAAYLTKISAVVIGKDITHVGNFAFAYATNAKTLIFEEGSKLETIGAASFLYLHYVTEVTIPETVTKIGNNAFSYCKELISVVVRESVTLIYPASFNKCNANMKWTVVAGSYAEKFAYNNSIAYSIYA